MNKQIAAMAVALTLVSASAGFAQMTQKPMTVKPVMKQSVKHTAGTPKMAAKSVYVCKECQAYWSPTAAKKMSYKDGMGHKLTKMSKAPAGFTDGSKMKM